MVWMFAILSRQRPFVTWRCILDKHTEVYLQKCLPGERTIAVILADLRGDSGVARGINLLPSLSFTPLTSCCIKKKKSRQRYDSWNTSFHALTMTVGCQLSQHAIQLFPWEGSAAFQGNTVSPDLRQGRERSDARTHQPFILHQAGVLAVRTHAAPKRHFTSSLRHSVSVQREAPKKNISLNIKCGRM